MLQLNPPVPVDTPRGPVHAHMAIDYSREHYVLFVCFLCDTGECWFTPNRDVKLQRNMTMGVSPPANNTSGGTGITPAEAVVNRTAPFYPSPSNGNGATPHES